MSAGSEPGRDGSGRVTGPTTALARGGVAGVLSLIVERGAALLLVVALARLLGPEDYGRYSFVVSYLTIFQILADLGLEAVLLRRFAQEPAARARLLSAGLGLRLCLALAAGAIALLLVPWAAGRSDLRPLVAAGLPAVLWAAQPICRALLRAEMRLGDVLRVALLGALATLAVAGSALALGGGAGGVLLGVGLAQIASFALAYRRAGRRLEVDRVFDRTTWRSLLAEAWPVGLNVLVAVAGLRIAPILLMRERDAVDVGAFASAARLAEALNLLADGVLLAVFPVLARLATTRREDARALAALTARYLAVAFLGIGLFLDQVAEPLMVLLFGPSFAFAGPALALLAWNAVLSALGSLYANLLVIGGQQRVLLALNGISALVQVAVQVVLVRSFGLLGAAAGVLAAACANHVVLGLLRETRAEIRPCLRAALGPAVVAASLFALAPAIPIPRELRAVLLPAALATVMLIGPFRADRRALHRLLAAAPRPGRQGEAGTG